jgi:hypothetical protein
MSSDRREPYSERRRAPRIQNLDRFEAKLLTGEAVVRLHDLGAGGFSTTSDLPFTVGEVHRFTITGANRRSAEFTARVAYSRPVFVPRDKDRYFTGFAFTALDAADRQAVDRILDQLITSAISFE